MCLGDSRIGANDLRTAAPVSGESDLKTDGFAPFGPRHVGPTYTVEEEWHLSSPSGVAMALTASDACWKSGCGRDQSSKPQPLKETERPVLLANLT